MNDAVKVKGIILSASPMGEQDKRVVLQTCELGRITAFAMGCRRGRSALQAAVNPFVTGEFWLIPGKSAYRITEASVMEYFRELASLQPGVYMGFYFLDLVDFYGREGIDGTDMLNLLYISLKALLKKQRSDKLIRRIFELKLMALNGDYAPIKEKLPEKIYNVCAYIARAPIGRLYAFDLDDEGLRLLSNVCDKEMSRVIDRKLKSKAIMEAFYD